MRGLAASLALVGGLLLSGCAASELAAPDHRGGPAAAEFERVKTSPVELRMFLQRFPKGGDLHNHLSGAVYAEDFIGWAMADGVCLDLDRMAAVAPPCDADGGQPELADALARGQIGRDQLIDAWSMRNFVPGISAASGHAQFFDSFSLFDGAKRGQEMLAMAVENAAHQQIGYLELMISPEMWSAQEIARQVGGGGFEDLYRRLLAAGIEKLVPRASAQLDAMEAYTHQYFDCPASGAAACDVEVRYLAQVVRTVAPELVFAQSLLAFLLIEQEPRFVGLNFVAPEDHPVTLATYDAQMEALRFLAERRGSVPIALHAGELTLGLVPPRYLRDHIRKAIEVAGARRIGHGVAIAFEQDAEKLLLEMAERPVVVEINLTSNDVILGVKGEEHPFETYRAYGVPLTLSTDDEGVSRGDLTREYQRAVETYDLDYADILRLSRNALSYAFIEGTSLWQDPQRFEAVAVCRDDLSRPQDPDEVCAAFLAANPKARLQWRLERQLAAFDAERAALWRARMR